LQFYFTFIAVARTLKWKTARDMM